jgi:hypothetical protein
MASSCAVAPSSLPGIRLNRTPIHQNTIETVEKCSLASSQPHSLERQCHDLLIQAEALASEEQLLAAARVLERIDNQNCFQRHHYEILERADIIRAAVADIIGDPDDKWIRQGESHGQRDTLIYYHVDETGKLTCRIETPIEQSLLVPLLSVLNEVELFSDWFPKWKHPKMGLRSTELLAETGRRGCNKVLLVTCDSPWPLCAREVAIRATAVDDIDSQAFIVVHLQSISEGVVPQPAQHCLRIDLDGAFLFRACPNNHPILKTSKRTYGEPLILVTFKFFEDAKMGGLVPKSVLNFITRTGIGQIWNNLLNVAESIQTGERPRHEQAIARKRDFYAWVEGRIQAMFEKLTKDAEETCQYEFMAYLQG